MTSRLSSLANAASTQPALAGAGTGATIGLLTALFKEDPSIKDLVKHTLLGGGIGAAAGAGFGAVNGKQEPAAPPAPPASHVTGRGAALSGLFPIVGPSIYGAVQGKEGEKLENALKLGGSSWAGSMPGGMLQQLAASKGRPGMLGLGALLTLAGSAAGSGMMGKSIEGQAKQATVMDSLKNLGANVSSGIGNIEVNPLNPGSSAVTGGLGGAALGGGLGLVKALLDNDEDGILGTINKALQGAAIGGVGGAALGGGYSALRRHALIPDKPQNAEDADSIARLKRLMGNYTVPLKAEASRILGGDPSQYTKEIRNLNVSKGLSHMLSPVLNTVLEDRMANPGKYHGPVKAPNQPA